MPYSHPSSKPLSVPDFQSKLPASLLDGLSDLDRYLYEEANRNAQMMEWLVARSAADAETLDGVLEQTTKTNGRMTAAEADIRAIKEAALAQRDQVKPVVEAYALAGRAARNKWVWATVAVFVFVAMPWLILHAPAPVTFFKAAASALFGL